MGNSKTKATGEMNPTSGATKGNNSKTGTAPTGTKGNPPTGTKGTTGTPPGGNGGGRQVMVKVRAARRQLEPTANNLL